MISSRISLGSSEKHMMLAERWTKTSGQWRIKSPSPLISERIKYIRGAKLHLLFSRREHDTTRYFQQPLQPPRTIAFSDLPADVVHTIIQVADKGTAKALSRTSKSLHQLAEPVLYRDITLVIDPAALLQTKYAFGEYLESGRRFQFYYQLLHDVCGT